jgi:hypothetical protein
VLLILVVFFVSVRLIGFFTCLLGNAYQREYLLSKNICNFGHVAPSYNQEAVHPSNGSKPRETISKQSCNSLNDSMKREH